MWRADNSGLKTWNDITSGISRDGGYHFTQDNQLYHRQGGRLYRANPMQGGDYSVSPVPGDEAGKIHDREILANGQPVYARNKVYTHHEGTVYGTEKRPDGSPRLYSLSPHEDEDVYAIVRRPGRSEGTAVEPMIDPVAVGSAGLTGGVRAFAHASGPTLHRLGAGLQGEALSAARGTGFQLLGIRIPWRLAIHSTDHWPSLRPASGPGETPGVYTRELPPLRHWEYCA